MALNYIKTLPCGAAEYCWLSYEPENEVAKKMYGSFGFIETGEMDGEEVIAVLKLSSTMTCQANLLKISPHTDLVNISLNENIEMRR